MKWIRRKEGILVIEAALVMSLVVVFIVVLINLGLILYQRTLVRTVAYDTANQISHIVGTRYRDPFMAYKDITEFYHTDLYRHIVSRGEILSINEEKAVWYAYYRLRRGEILLNTEPTVNAVIESKQGYFMQRQVVVTVTATLSIPLTAFWGGDHTFEYVAIGRANVMDLIDYIHTVDFTYELIDAVIGDIDVSNIREVMEIYRKFREH